MNEFIKVVIQTLKVYTKKRNIRVKILPYEVDQQTYYRKYLYVKQKCNEIYNERIIRYRLQSMVQFTVINSTRPKKLSELKNKKLRLVCFRSATQFTIVIMIIDKHSINYILN